VNLGLFTFFYDKYKKAYLSSLEVSRDNARRLDKGLE